MLLSLCLLLLANTSNSVAAEGTRVRRLNPIMMHQVILSSFVHSLKQSRLYHLRNPSGRRRRPRLPRRPRVARNLQPLHPQRPHRGRRRRRVGSQRLVSGAVCPGQVRTPDPRAVPADHGPRQVPVLAGRPRQKPFDGRGMGPRGAHLGARCRALCEVGVRESGGRTRHASCRGRGGRRALCEEVVPAAWVEQEGSEVEAELDIMRQWGSYLWPSGAG